MNERIERWIASVARRFLEYRGEQPKLSPYGTRPIGGEATSVQAPTSSSTTAMPGIGFGYGEPPPGTYQTYREIAKDSTAHLAFCALTAPILGSPWSIEAVDNTVPSEVTELISAVFTPLRDSLLRDHLRACWYGWAGFERVFDLQRVNGTQRVVYRKVKWLQPDLSKILIDRDTGDFAGIRQQSAWKPTVDLLADRAYVYTLDGEGADYYGTALAERAREPWSDKKEERQRVGTYSGRIAGTIPIVMYPAGKSIGPDGGERDNREIAVAIRDSLANSKGIVVENLSKSLIDGDPRAAAELADKALWKITTLDAGTTNHTAGFNDRIRQCEGQIVRAFLSPERSVIEAQTAGSRADSLTAADLGLQMATLLYRDIVDTINAELVDPLLYYNFGREMIGKVRISAGDIVRDALDYQRTLMQALMTNPTLMPEALSWVDWDAVLDRVGLPKADREINVSDGSVNILTRLMQTPETTSAPTS